MGFSKVPFWDLHPRGPLTLTDVTPFLVPLEALGSGTSLPAQIPSLLQQALSGRSKMTQPHDGSLSGMAHISCKETTASLP